MYFYICSRSRALRHFYKDTQTCMHINAHTPSLPSSYSLHSCFNRLLLDEIDNISYSAGLSCSNYNHIQKSSFKEKIDSTIQIHLFAKNSVFYNESFITLSLTSQTLRFSLNSSLLCKLKHYMGHEKQKRKKKDPSQENPGIVRGHESNQHVKKLNISLAAPV